MLTFKTSITLTICLLGATFVSAASKSDPVNHESNGVAIRGYDPVAYFTDSKPVKGDPKFTFTWRGAMWQFASAGHRDLFEQNPEKYAPEYGGYCAYGISQGHAVDVDPSAWKIIEGKLYLNYSLSVRERFLKDPGARIKEADQNWPGLHK